MKSQECWFSIIQRVGLPRECSEKLWHNKHVCFLFLFSRVELRNYVFCSRFPIRLMRIRNKSLQMFSLHKLKHDTTTKLVCSHWLYVYPHSHTSFLLKWFHTKYHVSQILSWENVFMWVRQSNNRLLVFEFETCMQNCIILFLNAHIQWKIVNSVCTHTSIFQYFTVVSNCDHRGWCLREWSPCLKNLEVFIVLRKQMNYTDRLRFIDDLLSYGRDEMWREQKKRMLSSHNIVQCYTEDCSRVV